LDGEDHPEEKIDSEHAALTQQARSPWLPQPTEPLIMQFFRLDCPLQPVRLVADIGELVGTP
jgi:hypothetical protein